jgi:hypothetical protein
MNYILSFLFLKIAIEAVHGSMIYIYTSPFDTTAFKSVEYHWYKQWME